MLCPLTVDTRLLDAATCEAQHISSYQLMERAAGTAVDAILHHYPNRHTRFLIMAGPGNNGGDALVVVRRLYESGYPVTAFLYDPRGHLSPDCAEALTHVPEGVVHPVNAQMELPELAPGDVIVDGLLGSGLNKPLVDGYAYLVRWINQSPADVVAIDVPSGLPFDRYTPEESPAVVRATLTLTFGFPKLCFFQPECAEFLGRWHVLDIGLIPPESITLSTPYRLLTHADAAALYRPRTRFSHKGTYGHAALVAGSYGMMGAALMTARACLRSGAGLLTAYVPACGYEVMQTGIPEAKCACVGEQHVQHFALPDGHDAIGIGPGLGTARETALALHYLLEHATRPMVLDADALNLLGSHHEWWKLLPPGTILTPHPKEADRLLQSAYRAGFLHGAVSASPESMSHLTSTYHRLTRIRHLAREAHLVIVLKGAYTAIALPDGTAWLNTEYGHSGMAVGGSGDTLTGIILALLAAHYPPSEAARLGVYLHSLAADVALEGQSEESWLPGDLIHCLGRAFRRLTE